MDQRVITLLLKGLLEILVVLAVEEVMELFLVVQAILLLYLLLKETTEVLELMLEMPMEAAVEAVVLLTAAQADLLILLLAVRE